MSAGLDVQRLAKVLGLLGSSHDGEVAAAGRAAHEIIRQAGATWFDLLAPPLPAPRPTGRSDAFGMVEFCLRHPAVLTEWEARFLHSLRRRSRISPKQQAIVDEIVIKVERRAATRTA
jgi:hypothetical protein